jgi:hypothetical protein
MVKPTTTTPCRRPETGECAIRSLSSLLSLDIVVPGHVFFRFAERFFLRNILNARNGPENDKLTG